MGQFFSTVIAGALGSLLSTKLDVNGVVVVGFFVIVFMAVLTLVAPRVARMVN